jgi:ferredoxin--NADP+ reductase
MVDITHFLIEQKHVDEVIAVARRGPGEIKFDKKELETVVSYLDLDQFNHDVDALSVMMAELGQNPVEPKMLVNTALQKAAPKNWDTLFRIKFLATTTRILGMSTGR